MNVPLCQMVPMLVVCPTLNIDIMKMKHAFQMVYKEGDKVFYLSSTNWKGEKNTIDEHEQLWNVQWWEENKRIFFMENPHLHRFLRCMFFVWDGNHRLQAWVLYIKWVHDEDIFWHISMDFILLDISNGLMDNHDKLQQIWHHLFHYFCFLSLENKSDIMQPSNLQLYQLCFIIFTTNDHPFQCIIFLVIMLQPCCN